MLQIASNNYLLRTPLLPVNFSEKVFAEDIAQVAENKAFMYGLYLSSKDLYEEFIKQLEENKVTEKMRHSLQKYWSRASSRCTPYANFAGCSMGTLTDTTAIEIANPQLHKEACRLDMDLIYRFLKVLYADEKIREQITYHNNSTLYKLAGKYRYIRYTFSGKRSYFLAEIEPTPYLKHIMELCNNGASYNTLKDYLLQFCDTEEDAKGFLNTIISNQIIVSELEPNVSGDEPFKKLLSLLKNYNHTEQYVQLIERINTTLKSEVFDIEKLKKVMDDMKDNNINIAVQTLFQCDVNTTTHRNTINKKVIDEVLEKAEDLIKIFKLGMANHESLEAFKRKFSEKYEGQTIPLFEAMDVENGIGYGNSSGNINPFISDIKFGNEGSATSNNMVEVINKHLNQTSPVHDPIIINKEQLQQNSSKTKEKGKDKNKQPGYLTDQNLYLMGTLYGKSAEDIDNGNYTFWLKMVAGTSHANLMSRFAHIDDAIGNWIQELTMNEEKTLPEDVIYAEVIHLPQERLGNISQRPVLRTYEIPYLGNSGADKEHQLPVSDLVVSIDKGRIILKSISLNKRVIPRLTNAHNYSMDSLPIYKFLCDLQFQQSFGGLSPDRLINISSNFTPRVVYEKLILKRATWKITADDFTNLKKDKARSLKEMQLLREKRNIPRKVVLLQSDNELLIDFNYEDSVQIFLSYVEKHQTVQIAEFLGDSENCFIQGEHGSFNSEMLLPVKITADVQATETEPKKTKKASTVKRVFVPGDEWIYFKIYCSTNAADEMIQGNLKKLVNQLTKKGLIEKFFFIRYTDPDFHLRLRFRLSQLHRFAEVAAAIRAFVDKYIAQRIITKVQIDTYVRELERYGEQSIDLSEHIFFTDSNFVINALNTLNDYDDEKSRWQIALAGIDAYLNEFGYDLADKVRFMEVLQKNFLAEFGNGQNLLHSLNDKYRNLKNPIFSLFQENEYGFEIDDYNKIIAQRAKANKAVVSSILKLYKHEPGRIDDILRSYIHMFINRLFASENRKHELALYHLLSRFYISKKAILQKSVTA